MDRREGTRQEADLSSSEIKTDGGDTQSISVSSDIRSISVSSSHDSSGNIDDAEEHRKMMLASLLEDYIRARAAEWLNTTNPGHNYTRNSPEIQPLARRLFADASRTLSANGVMSDFVASDALRNSRRQYLSALDNLVAGSQAPASPLPNAMRDLVLGTSQLTLLPHPADDSKLTLQPSPISHYQSSFKECALLGKGGFGKVYKCFNPLDQGTYAVKKIQLSPRLGRRFRDGKLEELQHILREVQALATLDHPNIVRYHATWLEEPHPSQSVEVPHGSSTKADVCQRKQLLLEQWPFSEDEEHRPEPSVSGGVVFAEDTQSCRDSNANDQLINEQQWFEKLTSEEAFTESLSLSNPSDIFTDGKSHLANTSGNRGAFDAVGYTLYIQMSLYPMTLAQYISLSSSGREALRHCFHLVPSLRLLHAIHAGLRYVHAKGFIHRDIKPGNIFLSLPEAEPRSGYCNLACNSCRTGAGNLLPQWLNPRIGDFGLVTQLARGELPLSIAKDNSSSTSNRPVGTTYYRPPSSKDADNEKVDIFALGVVFIEMVCPCATAMERVDMLQRLQMGCVPMSLEQGLEREGYAPEVIEEVVSLAEAMVRPDSRTRWSSRQVDEAIEEVLRKCEKP
ncbi:kinase-like protein [Daldinia caldariorum]|uniref:kinase-like protein n=1 Tax=Daldinia caldariorum TaxID=326644 RepID=UPI0020081AEE|nr:kinase-like protein [Daldinia caldariorum]KAI1472210.1 kinase-like protein [Daldinia caldariorum]